MSKVLVRSTLRKLIAENLKIVHIQLYKKVLVIIQLFGNWRFDFVNGKTS